MRRIYNPLSQSTPTPIQNQLKIKLNLKRSLATSFFEAEFGIQKQRQKYQELYWKVKSACINNNLTSEVEAIDASRMSDQPISAKIDLLKEIVTKNNLMVIGLNA